MNDPRAPVRFPDTLLDAATFARGRLLYRRGVLQRADTQNPLATPSRGGAGVISAGEMVEMDNDDMTPAEQHARAAAFLEYEGTRGHPITRWNRAIDVYKRELAAHDAIAATEAG